MEAKSSKNLAPGCPRSDRPHDGEAIVPTIARRRRLRFRVGAYHRNMTYCLHGDALRQDFAAIEQAWRAHRFESILGDAASSDRVCAALDIRNSVVRVLDTHEKFCHACIKIAVERRARNHGSVL